MYTMKQKTYILICIEGCMAKRKIGNPHTTICITWNDKDELRKFAKLIKKTKNGDMYESDSAVFHRMLDAFKNNNESSDVSHNTYPRKSTSQEHDQQG